MKIFWTKKQLTILMQSAHALGRMNERKLIIQDLREHKTETKHKWDKVGSFTNGYDEALRHIIKALEDTK